MDKKRNPGIKVGNELLQIILIKVPTQIFLPDLISHLVSHQLIDLNWKVVSCSIAVDIPSSYFQRQESWSCNVKKYVNRSFKAVIKTLERLKVRISAYVKYFCLNTLCVLIFSLYLHADFSLLQFFISWWLYLPYLNKFVCFMISWWACIG